MTNCARVAGHCKRCDIELPFAFTMAFQPIVDVQEKRILAYEALVRGPQGESAWSILSRVDDRLLYRFDQACRVRAIELASELGMPVDLSINFLPNAVYEPSACIQNTLATARRLNWDIGRLNFEITETERIRDRGHLRHIVDAYREMGFHTSLDDFGSGHANLDLLVELTPDTLKLDLQLVRDIDRDPRRQALVRATIGLAGELGIGLVAEGVETVEEARWLRSHGIMRQQGYFFARPMLTALAGCPDECFAALDD
ncbi:EAL domain-containing protein (putative c-di-GMP-specific phosphodiesterase class I) [Kushneria sinocarnis]|uniref:EAL domain-containing protein (Putative c-di-GMP-specific phosphodiesterase class I) n=1 Tax=Kushneria sinocarnis TaxID=595502 RepID=A0A420WXA7_9GAMM|nr:EAL domain-containing protein [Kushneria sinocarnis]RKR04374.1 EAL domain-containing protein (putative c-di-GMP-specific phosphodiesterase class I) [Kushneria sinocarnis]